MIKNDTSSNIGDASKVAGDAARTALHGAFDHAGDKVVPALESLATGAQDAIDKVGDTIDKVSHSIDDVSSAVAERAKQLGASYKQFADSGRECVRGSPLVSVLLALAAGYCITKLFAARN